MHVLRTRFARLAAALCAAVLLLVAAPPSRAAFQPPEWALDGKYDVDVPAGFHSLVGRWAITLEGENSPLWLSYDKRGRITGNGVANTPAAFFTFVVEGTSTVDPDTGGQHVVLREPGRHSRFRFEGDLDEEGKDLVGTFEVEAGYANVTVDDSGPMTILRIDPPSAATDFRLALKLAQSYRGRIGGADTGEVTARGRRILDRGELSVFGHADTGDRVFENGRISGRVKRLRDGTLRGAVVVRGRGWFARLVGPVDEEGFHAVCTLRGGPFRVSGVDLLLPVVEGPEAPPPPPPPPPRNLVTGAVARISAGQMEITHDAVPRRFFKKAARLTVQFPTSDGLTTVTADPTTSGGQSPRRFFITIGGTSFGTALDPASVTLEIREFSTLPGGVVEVLCTGEVRSASGAKRAVDLLLRATVAQ